MRDRELRTEVIRIYGGECRRCGETADLQFDHVNGDGADHRAMMGTEDPRKFIKHLYERGCPQAPDGFELQLLCVACHRNKSADESRVLNLIRQEAIRAEIRTRRPGCTGYAACCKQCRHDVYDSKRGWL